MTKTKIIEVAAEEKKLYAYYTKELEQMQAREKSNFPLQPDEKFKYVARVEYMYLLSLASEALALRIQIANAMELPPVGCGDKDCPHCGGNVGGNKCH